MVPESVWFARSSRQDHPDGFSQHISIAICSSLLILVYVVIFNLWTTCPAEPESGLTSIAIGCWWSPAVAMPIRRCQGIHSWRIADRNWLNTFTVMIVPFLKCLFVSFPPVFPMPANSGRQQIDGASHFQYFTRWWCPSISHLPSSAFFPSFGHGIPSCGPVLLKMIKPDISRFDRIDAFTRAQGGTHLLMAAATIGAPSLSPLHGSHETFHQFCARIDQVLNQIKIFTRFV